MNERSTETFECNEGLVYSREWRLKLALQNYIHGRPLPVSVRPRKSDHCVRYKAALNTNSPGIAQTSYIVWFLSEFVTMTSFKVYFKFKPPKGFWNRAKLPILRSFVITYMRREKGWTGESGIDRGNRRSSFLASARRRKVNSILNYLFLVRRSFCASVPESETEADFDDFTNSGALVVVLYLVSIFSEGRITISTYLQPLHIADIIPSRIYKWGRVCPATSSTPSAVTWMI